jgi:PAS domain S-box-containing protein
VTGPHDHPTSARLQALVALTEAWSSPDVDEALRRIARAAVPHLADLCIVDVLEPGGAVRRAAVQALDADLQAAAEELARTYGPTLDSPQPVGRVLRSGAPELLTVVDDEVVRAHTFDDAHRALIQRIGIRSHLQVPIRAPSGEVLGGVGFGYVRAGLRFSAADVPIAEQFAASAARAIVEAGRRHDLRESEERARRLEERLRLALESGGVGTWDLDPQTGAISWDARCRAICGVAPGDDPDLTALLAEIVHPEDRARVETAVRQACSTDAPDDGKYEVAYRVRRRDDGGERWIAASGRAFFAEGKPVRFIGIAVDVTEVRRAEERLAEEAAVNQTLSRLGRLFSSELDRAKLAQLVTDEATRAVEASFGAFFFNEESADGGKYMLYTLSGAPIEAFSRFGMPRATAIFGPTFRGEGIVRLHDVRQDPRYGKSPPHYGMPAGHLPVVSYLAVPVIGSTGEVFGGLFFGHPEPGRFTAAHERIADGLAAMAGVAFENARLYQRLMEEQDHARTALEKAREAERRKDEFLAMLSHELRNPLAPILTAVSLMKMGQSSPERVRDVIERQVRHLSGLVEDLLDVSRITRGKMELKSEPIELADAVADGVEMASPLLEEKAHRLEVSVPRGLVVDGDRLRLAQVFANLLTNAARYTPAGGLVRVTAARTNDAIVTDVVDDGAGIPPELLAVLWEPFVQGARPLDRATGGLGLGLSLVRGLLELHHGRVEAFSAGLGQGSRFTVTLPSSTAGSDAAPVEETSRAAPGKGLDVLLVDDNRDHVELLAELLSDFGHRVEIALDGAEALARVEHFTPAVAVLDLGLPVMDGYELARQLRARLPHVRLLAVSGYGQPEDRRRSREAGFDVHFLKPVDPVVLARAIAEPGASEAR